MLELGPFVAIGLRLELLIVRLEMAYTCHLGGLRVRPPIGSLPYSRRASIPTVMEKVANGIA